MSICLLPIFSDQYLMEYYEGSWNPAILFCVQRQKIKVHFLLRDLTNVQIQFLMYGFYALREVFRIYRLQLHSPHYNFLFKRNHLSVAVRLIFISTVDVLLQISFENILAKYSSLEGKISCCRNSMKQSGFSSVKQCWQFFMEFFFYAT